MTESGGSGAGKTRFYAKPQLLQLNCSYIFTDPKGQVLEECGQLLKKAGYKIKVLNTIDFSKSMRYNPFSYIKKESDIMKVADALIEGTTTGKQQGEQFWLDAERLLYNALIGYIWAEGTEDERNFGTLLDMVNAMEIREDDDNFKNAHQAFYNPFEQDWSSKVTSEFGWRIHPISGKEKFHNGIDIGLPTGTLIHSCSTGTVIQSYFSESAGNYVIVQDETGYTTHYMHLSVRNVSAGDTVKHGDIIGEVGSTGNSNFIRDSFMDYDAGRVRMLSERIEGKKRLIGKTVVVIGI